MDKPASSHWVHGEGVLCYLQATKSLKLVYPRGSDFNLSGESDKDWSGDHDDRKSTTGSFELAFSRGAMSWQTGRQQTVVFSPVKQSIRVWLLQFKNQRSWDHYCVKGLSAYAGNSHCWGHSQLHQASCRAWDAQVIETHWHKKAISYEKKSMTLQVNLCIRKSINWQPICWRKHVLLSKLNNIDNNC